jgi:putative polyketide hydroxylase
MPSDEPQVLVVGGGPAGLTIAIALARQGIECLLVERRPAPSGLPRATVVSTRSMELVRSWGLEDEMLAGAVDVEWLLWTCETLARAAAGSAVPVGYPSREESAAVSPAAPACVPQDHLEPVLLEHLRSLEFARVELGTEVVGLDNRPDGVRAILRDTALGTERLVHADYAVAADGAHSTVRAALGIPMRGPDQLASVVNALFRAPLWRLLGEHRYGVYSTTDPRRALPGRPDVPGRRRRPPRDAPRRDRHEHGDPRRLRPGLEARLGAARLGQPGAP